MISTPVPNIRVIAIQNPPASPVRPAGRSPWWAAADDFVAEIYRQGFVQSLIIHVALLLVLALVVIQPVTPEPYLINTDHDDSVRVMGYPEPGIQHPDEWMTPVQQRSAPDRTAENRALRPSIH